MTTLPEPELVVLVDDDGAAIGTAEKSAVHDDSTPLHLGFSCYIVDGQGRVLVTRRAHDKTTFPGVLTNSVCGHPAPGEPVAVAVRRRAYDELGMGLDEVRLVLPGFSYRAEMNGIVENELCPVLVAFTDTEPQPVPEEVAETRWVPWSELRDGVIDGSLDVSHWCREQVPLLDALGPDPRDWPLADREGLPAALRF